MEKNKLMLLFQLVRGIESSLDSFEKAYKSSDKQKFEEARAYVLDFQKKIDFLIKQ